MLAFALYALGCVLYVYHKSETWPWTAITHTLSAAFLAPQLICAILALHYGRKTEFMCDFTYRIYMILYLLCTAAIYGFYYSKQLLVSTAALAYGNAGANVSKCTKYGILTMLIA